MSRFRSTLSRSSLSLLLSDPRLGVVPKTHTPAATDTAPNTQHQNEPAGGGSLDELNLQRLLRRLSRDGSIGVTVAELLASGVTSPAQSVYDLQLAGYDIQRISGTHAGAFRVTTYLLRAEPLF
jgi:hypothetical protein